MLGNVHQIIGVSKYTIIYIVDTGLTLNEQ